MLQFSNTPTSDVKETRLSKQNFVASYARVTMTAHQPRQVSDLQNDGSSTHDAAPEWPDNSVRAHARASFDKPWNLVAARLASRIQRPQRHLSLHRARLIQRYATPHGA